LFNKVFFFFFFFFFLYLTHVPPGSSMWNPAAGTVATTLPIPGAGVSTLAIVMLVPHCRAGHSGVTVNGGGAAGAAAAAVATPAAAKTIQQNISEQQVVSERNLAPFFKSSSLGFV
jgi:hypothetical protein